MKPVKLTVGKTLYQPGKLIQHVYFPINCVVSFLTTIEKCRQLEGGMVGNEGMVGIPLVLGISVSPLRALVQCTVLGVLRSAVTIVAGNLQRRKLISYSRGRINILDPKGLEAAAYSCYEILKHIS